MKSDLIIIGGGPGGYETAIEAAHRGFSVTLFNGDKLGGTCLNEGCIPTKCLCRNAEVVSQFKNGEEFGIDDFSFTLDFSKVMERKNNVVSSLRSGVETLLKQAKVNVVDSKASFKDNYTIEADGNEYTADNIIIATGSVSKNLPIPGCDLSRVMNSTDLLSIDSIPESLTIIGGGVIGMEFASIFNQFGTKVTVVEFMKQILPPFDSDIAKRLKQILSKKGIKILTGAAAKEIRINENEDIELVYEVKGKEETVCSTHILMAVGRAPRVEELGLENTTISHSAKGIPVDDNMQTNVANIYAIGDVNAKMMLAHVASFQGLRALNAIEDKKDSIMFDVVPSAVFTVPECGMVGKTEEQCKKEGIEVLIGQSFFRANGKALALGEPDGLCKLIFDKESRLLIGAHIIGVEAADLVQQCGDLISRKTTIEQLRDIIFGHPTVSEVILSASHSVK
ncbi:MAG: dihydrolipoyl dehydrogenase [Muribaculaceae bacterium]|nr:dihydrolipoyl dehydrogenase [Muribaculaceae bacterium]MDE6754322.1 dihydrolipoyl dehydrogenase [Muribaculaceae bacterium]